jgi:choline dehydrogenase
MVATDRDARRFDYVVVGGGSAVCVMASRLSEAAGITVALIEAGGETDGLMVRMPAGLGELIVPNKHNWSFETEP